MILLELVANYEDPAGDHNLLNLVLKTFPEQLSPKRGKIMKTPTALHILVYNRNIKGASVLLTFADKMKQLQNVLSAEVRYISCTICFCVFTSVQHVAFNFVTQYDISLRGIVVGRVNHCNLGIIFDQVNYENTPEHCIRIQLNHTYCKTYF